ncbi:MAG: hypothetical protein IPK50_18940 [Fibrobacterota bacterium]|nr:MAG: hypothetical protein IPK50_18940 [Fibrobacterota bacterium]
MGNNSSLIGMLVLAAMSYGASKEPNLATLGKWARAMESQVPSFPAQVLSPVGGLDYFSREAVYDDSTQVPKFIYLFSPVYASRCERISHQAPFAYQEKFCYLPSKKIFNPDSCECSADCDDTTLRIMPNPFSLKEFDSRWVKDDDIGKYRKNYLQWRQDEIVINFSYDTLGGSLASAIYHVQRDSIVQKDEYLRYKNGMGNDTLVVKRESRYRKNKWETDDDYYRWIRYDSLGRIRWQRKAIGPFPDLDLDDQYASVPDMEYFYDSIGRNHLRLHRYPISKRLIALTSIRYDSLGRLDRQTVGYITKDSLIGWVFHLKWTYDSLGREKRVQEYENRPRIKALEKDHYDIDYSSPWWRW